MPDEATRDYSKRMHYAAWRASGATTKREATRWRGRHFDYRNRIVLGNRKLAYRAVLKWHSVSQRDDHLAGECQIVLIKAVAAFNPWLGIRFSTYAFNCLMCACPGCHSATLPTGCPGPCRSSRCLTASRPTPSTRALDTRNP